MPSMLQYPCVDPRLKRTLALNCCQPFGYVNLLSAYISVPHHIKPRISPGAEEICGREF
jgi:hypothetical protein